MKCPLTKGHYWGKHIQVMTSSWSQFILGKIWKPAVRSSRLAVMKITKHGYRVSLCKASTFSIVLDFYEPWAKGTHFEIYIPEITELIDHGSSNNCNEWVLIVSTYYVNIEAWVAMIQTAKLGTGVTNHFTSFVLKKESRIYVAPLFHLYEYLYVFDNKVGYRYNAVHWNMI